MTLEQLRFFIAVAEREHVTAAARALHVTQSAVSAAVSALEERHAVKLFHRVGRGIRLTEAGRLLLPEARAVLAQAAAAETMLDELSGLKRGTLRVVASQTIAAYWLPPHLVRFRARYPEIGVDLSISNTEEAARRVREGVADLGIIEGVTEDPVLAQWTVGQDELLLVQAAPWESGVVDEAWLRSARWVMREPGSGTRSALEGYLRGRGVVPEDLDVSLVLPSNESVRTAIEAGTLHTVGGVLGTRLFRGLRHRERYRSPVSDAFVTLTEESAG